MLPAWLLAQPPGFTQAKLRIKQKSGQPYLHRIKLYANDSRADAFLRQEEPHPTGLGQWTVFADPGGGTIEVFDWQSDSLCALSTQAQRAIYVKPQSPSGWSLQTLTDTFSIGHFQPTADQTGRTCTLSQQLRGPNGTLTEVPLVRFTYLPADPKWMDIADLATLRDVIPQVHVLAALLAAIHLTVPSAAAKGNVKEND
jgi:hypothetical protein